MIRESTPDDGFVPPVSPMLHRAMFDLLCVQRAGKIDELVAFVKTALDQATKSDRIVSPAVQQEFLDLSISLFGISPAAASEACAVVITSSVQEMTQGLTIQFAALLRAIEAGGGK